MTTEGKKRRLVICSAVFIASILLMCGSAQATDLDGVGTWAPSVDASDLTGGAGTNLATSCESAADQITLDITNAPSENGWRIDVRRTDIHWHNNLTLSVRRTGDGTGLGTILGGASYLPVSPSSSAFFSGLLDRLAVPLQIKLSGLSVAIPSDTYSTTLTFTVVDNE